MPGRSKISILLTAMLTVSACSTTTSAPGIATKKEPIAAPKIQTPDNHNIETEIPNPADMQTNEVSRCIADGMCETIPGEILIDPAEEVLPRIDYKELVPLIYGAPQPLVCSKPIPPSGKLKNRPNLQLMWENYIADVPQGVWAVIGGAVETNGCLPEDQGGWRNACTVRLSHMLNKAGHKIPYSKGKTVRGRFGEHHLYRLSDAEEYLERVFGKADLDINEGPGRWFELPQQPGLLIMRFPGTGFTGHATVWNGEKTVDDTDIAGDRVLFWELPCFIPLRSQ